LFGLRTLAVAYRLPNTILAYMSIRFSFKNKIRSRCRSLVYALISRAFTNKDSAGAAAIAATGTGI
jgi:hypothetical protein